MAIREFAGASKATSLSGTISAAATTINVTDASGYPTGATGPFVITISAGLASEEKVLVATRTGNTFSVDTRGYDGTTASDHENAASVQHTISAVDLREANAHVNDTAGDPHPQYLTPAEGAILYLGVGDKAADSNLLDGLDSTAFLTTTGKAADADLLDGLDSTAFIQKSIVDAAGDLIVGSGVDAVARLALGAAGTVLTSQGGTAAWVTGSSVQVVSGSYTGDGTATRTIAVGFVPKLVAIFQSTTFWLLYGGGSVRSLGSSNSASTASKADGVSGFVIQGGSGVDNNSNAVAYTYLAIG